MTSQLWIFKNIFFKSTCPLHLIAHHILTSSPRFRSTAEITVDETLDSLPLAVKISCGETFSFDLSMWYASSVFVHVILPSLAFSRFNFHWCAENSELSCSHAVWAVSPVYDPCSINYRVWPMQNHPCSILHAVSPMQYDSCWVSSSENITQNSVIGFIKTVNTFLWKHKNKTNFFLSLTLFPSKLLDKSPIF